MDFATKMCSLMGFWALIQAFIPPPLRDWWDDKTSSFWAWLFRTTDPFAYLDIHEKGTSGGGCVTNLLYRHVSVYLGSLSTTLAEHDRVNVHLGDEVGATLAFSLPVNETLRDTYEGCEVWWTHVRAESDKGGGGGLLGGLNNMRYLAAAEEQRSLQLKFRKEDRGRLLPVYLHHISKVAAEVERRQAQRQLYTNRYGDWDEVPFNHPSTFDTMALEAGLAERVQADLKAFSEGEEYYHKIGRAWKRGYLLYGPPGTGKSSMIAAISNFLHYDIYDLELTKVTDNSELKSLLMQTTRKSLIVIEDVDCTVDLSDRAGREESDGADQGDTGQKDSGSGGPPTRLTLSGLLNFTDGLWSCCGEERIFIFTTNHKDRLDPALLRSGRMDLHILLSFCTFSALQKMAATYLGLRHGHKLYPELERAMSAPGSPQLTPASVAETFLSSKHDPDLAIQSLLSQFKKKNNNNDDELAQLSAPLDHHHEHTYPPVVATTPTGKFAWIKRNLTLAGSRKKKTR